MTNYGQIIKMVNIWHLFGLPDLCKDPSSDNCWNSAFRNKGLSLYSYVQIKQKIDGFLTKELEIINIWVDDLKFD